MTKEKVGDACAYLGPRKYLKIGVMFRDTQDGRLSLKIDTLPLDKSWEGWVNVFPDNRASTTAAKPFPSDFDGRREEDNIPF